MKKRPEISAPGRSSGLGSVLVWNAVRLIEAGTVTEIEIVFCPSSHSSSPPTWASHSPMKNPTRSAGLATDFGFGFKMGTRVWVEVLVLIYPDLVPGRVLTVRPGIPAAWHLLLHALHRILAHTPILMPPLSLMSLSSNPTSRCFFLSSPLLLVLVLLSLLALLLPYSLISSCLLRLRLSLAPRPLLSLSLSSITLPGPPRWRLFQYLHNLTVGGKKHLRWWYQPTGTGWRLTESSGSMNSSDIEDVRAVEACSHR
ncbi:hypothetical protein BJ165DRAFT_1615373 [Panaeolus papilionaceus]|nr:hypothetical protein BJ165DRAFT_1615373 [Panaeolus papilionaceus]